MRQVGGEMNRQISLGTPFKFQISRTTAPPMKVGTLVITKSLPASKALEAMHKGILALEIS